jgi:GntR family transcriptional regulator
MCSMKVDIDRSPVAEPLWRQVMAAVEREIAEAGDGARLESEAALTKRFDVSRVTLRKALGELESQGKISASAGRGWFVAGQSASMIAEPPGLLQSFTEMARSRGMRTHARVLEATTRRAEWEESMALNIPGGSDIFVIRRLRSLNDRPVAVDESRVPEALLRGAPGVDWTTASLYVTLSQMGHVPARAEYEVRAISADRDHVGLLGVDEGFPLLEANQTTFDAEGHPMELGRIQYRSDTYSFRASLTA